MYSSTAVRSRGGDGSLEPPLRRIPWNSLVDEEQAVDQVWRALPAEGARRSDVERFLEAEGLAWRTTAEGALYAYADGPRSPESPVQSEWYLEFRLDDDRLSELVIERRLIGP